MNMVQIIKHQNKVRYPSDSSLLLKAGNIYNCDKRIMYIIHISIINIYVEPKTNSSESKGVVLPYHTVTLLHTTKGI